MYLFGTLRTTNQVSSSSIFFERRQTSLLLISPKPWKSQQTVDGKIALQLRGKSCIFYLGGRDCHFYMSVICEGQWIATTSWKGFYTNKVFRCDVSETSRDLCRHLQTGEKTERDEHKPHCSYCVVITEVLLSACVCVCVYVRERERERQR